VDVGSKVSLGAPVKVSPTGSGEDGLAYNFGDPTKSIFDDLSETSSRGDSADSVGSEVRKTRITNEQLEEVALRLGLIKLCWPPVPNQENR